MDAIFTENDFMLCRVPVPAGYPQSQTHAGVASTGDRVYLTSSPFPNNRYGLLRRGLNKIFRILSNGLYPPVYGDAYENPLLFWGELGETCPIEFSPYIGNPIASTPPRLFGLHAYNSDPDIYIEGHDIYVLNRECFHKSSGKDYWCRINQYHFIDRLFGADYVSSKILLETPSVFLSPSIAKWKGKYCMFYLETTSYNTGDSECRLYVRVSKQVDGDYEEIKELHIVSGTFVPWHLSVFEFSGELYSIVSCIKTGHPKYMYQMLGRFDEGLTTLFIYQRPLIGIPSYRGAAYIDANENMVLYSTTDCYHITGSKSVDGKDVIMMSKNFRDVLVAMKSGSLH